ncbi:MAG: hypothetical protein KJ571_08900 [Bacteroidetes bacterium]|nr:hypothetical protein [Bacteroidota bacterium]
MKNRLIQITIVIVFFSLTAMLSAGAFLNYFNTRSDNGNVVISWQTGAEDNVVYFIVQRKPASGSFIDLAKIAAKGNNSTYEYVDESAYKANDQVYVYQLKIVDDDNTFSFSGVSHVAHSVSGIKQTWGSIKALFR